MLCSIIIPTLNRASLIGETLDSIINQSYGDWECIVIDDGSTDFTKELIEFYILKDPRIKFFPRPPQITSGANSCRNYGFKLSKGQYINWFDSDDLMLPNKLQIQIEHLESSNAHFCVVETLYFEKNPSNVLELRRDKLMSSNPFEDYVQFKIFFLTHAPMFRRCFLEKQKKLFDPELKASQEWEFFSRLLSQNPLFFPIQKPLVLIRKHEGNISSTRDRRKNNWNYFISRYKIYSSDQITLSKNLKFYLINFLLDHFKQMVINGDFADSIKAYKMLIFKNKNLKLMLFGLLSILSYKFTGRGYIFLTNIQIDKLN